MHSVIIFGGDDVHPLGDQVILQMGDFFLVAWNNARGEDYRVAGIQFDFGMRLDCDTTQSRAWFALRACCHNHNLIARRQHRFVLAEEIIEFGQIAAFFGNFGVAPQGTSDQRDITPTAFSCRSNRLQTRDVAGKAGYDDALLYRGEQVKKFLLHRHFRTRTSGNRCVGRVSDNGHKAFFAQGAQLFCIADIAQNRIGIEFPVAGVQDRTILCSQDKHLRFGYRMGYGNIFALEGADFKIAARWNVVNFYIALVVGVTKFVTQKFGGEFGCINGALQLRPQMLDRADVIFMPVG